jgi:hypothetical protein
MVLIGDVDLINFKITIVQLRADHILSGNFNQLVLSKSIEFKFSLSIIGL